MTQDTTEVVVALDGQPVRLMAFEAGLACCGVEYSAASGLLSQLAQELPIEQFAPLDVANVLVISGTITHALAPAIRALHERLGPGTRVLSFGACAATGGPYWDSYAVLDGVDRIIPVDVYVPGCPPTPQALIEGLKALRAMA
ncbi:unannotated protein [freshwater metagenome]|uniref:Unannotated protein n=1 Tax=freshwater metagenome TaxID=449393 RepID=A0A6J7D3D0_9ZZZZ|nr:hypothetical protein [Actinomycetota bacterium]